VYSFGEFTVRLIVRPLDDVLIPNYFEYDLRMAGAVARYLEDDLTRIDAALQRAMDSGGEIEPESYLEFRGALLRHISMEEKILLPAARTANKGKQLPQFVIRGG